MKLVVYFSPYYYKQVQRIAGDDFVAEMKRAIQEYRVDGLYFDGISMDFRQSYRIIREARRLLGDKGVLYVHCSIDPLGIEIYCPFIDTYADYILRGESGRGQQRRNSYRWTVSGYNISNTVGYWCYYGFDRQAGLCERYSADRRYRWRWRMRCGYGVERCSGEKSAPVVSRPSIRSITASSTCFAKDGRITSPNPMKREQKGVRTEWHVNFSNCFAHLDCVKTPMFLQKLIWFGPSFHTSRLDSVGPIANDMRGHRRQQRVAPDFRSIRRQQGGRKG